MFENPRRGRQARNFTTNVPKILDLKSSSEQIFFRKLSLSAPEKWAVIPIFRCRKSQERQASKKFYKKCSENSTSQIVFRTDIFRKLTLDAPRDRARITLGVAQPRPQEFRWLWRWVVLRCPSKEDEKVTHQFIIL